jgi:hypothetical protein
MVRHCIWELWRRGGTHLIVYTKPSHRLEEAQVSPITLLAKLAAGRDREAFTSRHRLASSEVDPHPDLLRIR